MDNSSTRKKVTGSEIAERWQNPQQARNSPYLSKYLSESVILFTGLDIEGDIELVNLALASHGLLGLRLVDCKAENIRITLRGGLCRSIGSIYLTNSSIKSLYINATEANYIMLDGGSDITYLQINSCESLNDIHVKDRSVIRSLKLADTFAKNIYFSGKSQIGEVILYDQASSWSITFEESRGEYIHVSGNSKSGYISLRRGSTLDSIIIESECSARNISVDDSRLTRKIRIVNAVAEKILINSSQIGDVNISEQSSVLSIELHHSQARSIEIEDSIITSVTVESKSSIFAIFLHYLKEQSRRLKVQSSYVNIITTKLEKPYLIEINDSEIWTFSLEDKIFPRDSFLKIADTRFNEVIFDSFINQGTIVFSNVKPLNDGLTYKLDAGNIITTDSESRYRFEEREKESLIQIVNSDLGKASFIGCNLNQFNQFVFSNSKMLEVFIADTVLPKREKIESLRELKDEKLEQVRLALGQFKKIYENRGDVVNAIEYHALEMETYREYLGEVKPKLSGKDWWNNLGERINLFLNRHSSFYGNNWLKAVAVTLLVNWILFIIYCLFLGYYPGCDFKKFWELFSYSFEFLNPLRKADFVKANAETPDWSVIVGRMVDYLSRIVIAYFVYQTIQAFRKFGRKTI